jgi:RNase P subunit RPR2
MNIQEYFSKYGDVKQGSLTIEYKPTICMKCHKLLANTFVIPFDPFEDIHTHIFCNKCFDGEKGCLRRV